MCAQNLISSRGNAAVKLIRSLRSRVARTETGLFLAEGIRITIEAVELGAAIETVIVAPELLRSDAAWEAVEESRAMGAQVLYVTSGVFHTLSSKEGPQGIAVVARQRWAELSELDPGTGLCWVALDSIQDPGNLGSVVRTIDAVGGAGLITMGPSADPYDPAALRASMGALFSLDLARSSFEDFLTWTSENGVHLVGTSDRGRKEYRAVSYTHPLVLLMGSERQGLSETQMEACDELVRIPMAGRSDSLNVAVASGIVLYEIFQQRRDSVDALLDPVIQLDN